MASLAPKQSADSVSILVKYRAPRSDLPVYVASNANDWTPEQMTQSAETTADGTMFEHTMFQHTITAPRHFATIVYKFRVGDGEWVFNPDSPTEPDGFWGMNNRFEVPTDLPPTPPPERLADSINEQASKADNDGHFLDDKQEAQQRTALPSPAASPRDRDTDSGTEIDAPSISDWEPTSDADHLSNLDAASDSEILHGSPTPSARAGPFSMSEPADWIVI